MDENKKLGIERRLVRRLWAVHHILSRLTDGSASRNRVLTVLRDHGDMPQNELTRLLGVQPGTVSEVLGKLESSGLLLRTPNKNDRRTADVRLTPEGKIAAEEAVSQRKKRYKKLFQCLSKEEQETLYSLLQRLTEDWEKQILDN